MVIVAGWVFASRRTVTAMLVSTGAHNDRGGKHFSTYHRLFSRARWSLDRLGLLVLSLIEPWLDSGSILLTLDDTLSRKRGTKMFGTGMHHDPLASSKRMAVMSWGHSWVVLCVAVRLPFAPQRWFSLPIFFRLYLNRNAATRHRLAYRTRPELAVELLRLVCDSRPQRRFHAVADSAYGGESVLGHLPDNCDLTSRIVLDARLHAMPPSFRNGKVGRPRKRGVRLPSPAQMLKTRGQHICVDIYGRRNERMRVVSTMACVYKVPHRQLRIVAVDPLVGGRPQQAFFSTCTDDGAITVLTRYAARWSIEEMNQASKSHLGFEQPQGWTRRAVERTAPLAMLLYSVIVIWFAQVGHRFFRLPTLAWYPGKRLPSFADILHTLRRESLRTWISAQLPEPRLRRNVLPLLLSAARMAA
jgi:SRSO17 transposase